MKSKEHENLVSFVKVGDCSAVKRLLSQGENADSCDEGGTPALGWAVAKGHIEILDLLLLKGADPNFAASDGMTPLVVACMKGESRMVKTLLDNGADTNARAQSGTTPIISAVSAGSAEIVQLLMDSGADIDTKGPRGGTPLLFAAQGQHFEVAKLLLQHGASVDLQSDSGLTPLMQAARAGNVDIVKLLLDHGADVEIRDKYEGKAEDMARGAGALPAGGKEAYRHIAEILSERARTFETPEEVVDRLSNGVLRKALESAHRENGIQELTKALAFSPCKKCGQCEWVKPDRTAWKDADFEAGGYASYYGFIVMCRSCGNMASVKHDNLLNIDIRGKVRRPRPEETSLSSDVLTSPTLWPSLLTLEDEVGVLFDVSSIDSSSYGETAWKIVFESVRPKQLAGCNLFCGDVEIRVGSLPYSFCIGVSLQKKMRSDRQPLQDFSCALWRSNHACLPQRHERFIYGSIRETLGLAACLSISVLGDRIFCSDNRTFGWILRLAAEMGWGKFVSPDA